MSVQARQQTIRGANSRSVILLTRKQERLLISVSNFEEKEEST